MEKQHYFYRTSAGRELGQFTMEELRALVAKGEISVITKVRPERLRVWRDAYDMPELQSAFRPASTPSLSVASKPIAQLAVGDLPGVVLYFLKRYTDWIFLLLYLPTVIPCALGLGQLVMVRSALMRMPVARGLEGTFFPGVLLFGLAWLIIVPLGIWLLYKQRRFGWRRFVIGEVGAYVTPIVLTFAWTVRTEMTWVDLVRQMMPR